MDDPERGEVTRVCANTNRKRVLAAGHSVRVEGGFDIEGWHIALRDAPRMLCHVHVQHAFRQKCNSCCKRGCIPRLDGPRTVQLAYESFSYCGE